MHLYLAEREWKLIHGQGPGFGWDFPVPTISAIDLRGMNQNSQRGGTPGYSLIATNVQHDGLAGYLGEVELQNLAVDGPTTARKKALERTLGITGGLNSITYRDIMVELFMEQGDPTHVDRWGPLRGSYKRGVGFWFANTKIWSDTFGPTHRTFLNTIAEYRASYTRWRERAETFDQARFDVELEHLKRVTGGMLRKLRLTESDIAAILPAQYITDGSLDPRTTVSDNFNRANEALDTGGNWTESSGTWTVTSNECAKDSTAYETARFNSALSSTDHTCTITVTARGANDRVGCAVGYAAAAETCYIGYSKATSSPYEWIEYFSSGTHNTLYSNTGASATPNFSVVFKLDEGASSNTLTLTVDGGTPWTPATDSSIAVDTYAGVFAREDVCALDDFTCSDDVAGGANPKGPLGMPLHGPFAGPVGW